MGQKIGEGGGSDVFEWGNNQVIKLAKSNFSVYGMELEFRNCRIAWEAGLHVPETFDFVTWNNRPGIIYEKIEGVSLYDVFIKNLSEAGKAAKDGDRFLKEREGKADSIGITASVLAEIHQTPIPTGKLKLRPQREGLEYAIRNGSDYLSPSEKEVVIELLDQMPKKEQFCHGDPNPGNIIIRDGKPVIIDWMDASVGSPEADIAEYVVMIRYAVLPPTIPAQAVALFDAIREDLISRFIEEYRQLADLSMEDLDKWIIIIAARKLFPSAIREEEKELLAKLVRKESSEIVEK
nr:aminoglycoside phosphotransferase family protein [Bacillus alkalicola]